MYAGRAAGRTAQGGLVRNLKPYENSALFRDCAAAALEEAENPGRGGSPRGESGPASACPHGVRRAHNPPGRRRGQGERWTALRVWLRCPGGVGEW